MQGNYNYNSLDTTGEGSMKENSLEFQEVQRNRIMHEQKKNQISASVRSYDLDSEFQMHTSILDNSNRNGPYLNHQQQHDRSYIKLLQNINNPYGGLLQRLKLQDNQENRIQINKAQKECQNFRQKHFKLKMLVYDKYTEFYTLDLSQIFDISLRKFQIEQLKKMNRILINQINIGYKITFQKVKLLFDLEWPSLESLIYQRKIAIINDSNDQGLQFLKVKSNSKNLIRIELRGNILSNKMVQSLLQMQFPKINFVILHFTQQIGSSFQFNEILGSDRDEVILNLMNKFNDSVQDFKFIELLTDFRQDQFVQFLRHCIADEKLYLRPKSSQEQLKRLQKQKEQKRKVEEEKAKKQKQELRLKQLQQQRIQNLKKQQKKEQNKKKYSINVQKGNNFVGNSFNVSGSGRFTGGDSHNIYGAEDVKKNPDMPNKNKDK